MAPPLPGDKKAGFTGLIVGAIVIFCIMFSIVLLTNRHYEGKEPAAAATTP
ncbi:MAG TPA: hypothetical protein VJO52_02105 [Gemmatimonadaceae bacterium]|nr:hypothetical protein [Gemmatimonadaceae bacterium]